MAKNSAQRAAGPARVSFTMVEAEMPDGDLTHITHAIQNALRPVPGMTPPRAIGQIAQPAPASSVALTLGPESPRRARWVPVAVRNG
jgi:hypothetical protein